MAGFSKTGIKRERGQGKPFKKGQPGGPGRPKGSYDKKAAELKAALLAAITEQDIKDIAAGLIRAAKKGEARAAKELFDRVWGKAPQAVEVTGEGGGDIRIVVVGPNRRKSKPE